MEADLSRFHGIRYSDRWRFDTDGTRKLTLREIWVRVQDLPGESRIAKHYNNGQPRWNDETYLLSDLAHILSGKPHPARPKPVNASRLDSPRRQEILRRRAVKMRARSSTNGR